MPPEPPASPGRRSTSISAGRYDLLAELLVQQMEVNQYPVLRKVNNKPCPEALLRLFMTELNLARSCAPFKEVP